MERGPKGPNLSGVPKRIFRELFPHGTDFQISIDINRRLKKDPEMLRAINRACQECPLNKSNTYEKPFRGLEKVSCGGLNVLIFQWNSFTLTHLGPAKLVIKNPMDDETLYLAQNVSNCNPMLTSAKSF
jgi:hypothetical protein